LFTDTGNPDGGVDIILSEELRANIQKAVDSNCNDINAQCVDGVKYLLVNPHTELESRQVVAVGASVFAVVALAIPWWGKSGNQGVPVALHIPSTQLDPAASAASAATVVAVTGSGVPFVTIVPSAKAPTPTGYV
jgi:hypothetical protein